MRDVIVCGGEHGRAVLAGQVESDPVPGQPVKVHNARMVLYWAGKAGLFGLAAKGPAEGSRITAAVPSTTLVCTEWMDLAPAAVTALAGWPDAA